MEFIEIDKREETTIIQLSRERKLNTLNGAMISELADFLEKDLEDTRCFILTGAGNRAFCAGGDISEMAKMTPQDAAALSFNVERVTRKLESLSIPVISAVNGLAFGGGLELAMAGDFIYGVSTAKVGQPEVNLGLIPGFGGCVRLQRYVGRARAREMILTGRPYSALEAKDMGLFLEVFANKEEMLFACLKVAKQIVSQKPNAIRVAKKVLNQCDPLEEELQLERKGYFDVFAHPDSQKGIHGFLSRK